MGKKIINLLKLILQKLLSSFKRFPVALTFAVATVVTLITFNHLDYRGMETQQNFVRAAMTLALGIPISLCIKMYFERTPHNNRKIIGIIYGIAFALLGGYYYFFLRQELDMVNITRYIGLTIAFYVAFTFIPYFYKRQHYDLYIIKLITRFCIVFVYSVVLFLGLIAIIFTIEKLFSVGIPEELFFDIWLMVAGIFAPAYFLGEIPKYEEDMVLEDYPKVFKVLVLYIVMPLLSVYTIILYSYFVKILVTRQWPQGIISNLVLWYAVISTAVIFLIQPIVEENQWAKIFKKILPKAIVPLLAMMFVSLFIRINAYGITERRYFVLVLGLWVTGSMVYFAIKKIPRNILLGVSFSLIALLSVLGPVSSYSISRFSQNMRLESILTQYDLLEGGQLQPKEEVPKEAKEEISEIIYYFDRYHSLKDLKYVPKEFKLEEMKKVFGFDFGTHAPEEYHPEYFNFELDQQNNIFDIKGFDYFVPLEYYRYNQRKIEVTQDNFTVQYNESKNEVSMTYEGKVIYTKNLEEIALDIRNSKDYKKPLSAEELTIKDENQEVEVYYGFKRLMVMDNMKTAEFSLESFEMYIFVKLK